MLLADDEFSPPASYYANATGTGATLKSQLTTAMSAGHIERAYGDFRSSAAIHDQDPNNSSRILLCYNRFSVSSTWDSGSTWNREHVWPQSRQPGSASNSTRGNLGDPHSLLPCNPSINSSRGNKPFGGGAETTGNNRSLGSYYFPGDSDKGDVARSLFYSATRYSSTGLTLVNGIPSGNQMGDLASLIAWHYLDAPDTFERRRNHAIYSSTLNPAFRTNNRNAFVDHPEFAWSVFMDQMNDTTLWFGDLEPADGASSIDLNLSVLVGDSITPMDFVLNKGGNDGTYYKVSATEGLVSSINDCFNAFAMSDTDLSQPITLSFDSDLTDAAGTYDGELRVDNLDVTTMGGTGNGANDIDDIVFVSIDVYDSGNASFDDMSDMDSMSVDLGSIGQGAGDGTQSVSIFNIASGATGAPIDIEFVSASGDTAALSTSFTAINSLSAASSSAFDAILADAIEGDFSATYTFRVYNDQALFASPSSIEDLTLVLNGEVGSGGCPADFAEPFGELNFFDVSSFLAAFSAGDMSADLNDDTTLNFFDVSAFLAAYGAGCP